MRPLATVGCAGAHTSATSFNHAGAASRRAIVRSSRNVFPTVAAARAIAVRDPHLIYIAAIQQLTSLRSARWNRQDKRQNRSGPKEGQGFHLSPSLPAYQLHSDVALCIGTPIPIIT